MPKASGDKAASDSAKAPGSTDGEKTALQEAVATKAGWGAGWLPGLVMTLFGVMFVLVLVGIVVSGLVLSGSVDVPAKAVGLTQSLVLFAATLGLVYMGLHCYAARTVPLRPSAADQRCVKLHAHIVLVSRATLSLWLIGLIAAGVTLVEIARTGSASALSAMRADMAACIGSGAAMIIVDLVIERSARPFVLPWLTPPHPEELQSTESGKALIDDILGDGVSGQGLEEESGLGSGSKADADDKARDKVKAKAEAKADASSEKIPVSPFATPAILPAAAPFPGPAPVLTPNSGPAPGSASAPFFAMPIYVQHPQTPPHTQAHPMQQPFSYPYYPAEVPAPLRTPQPHYVYPYHHAPPSAPTQPPQPQPPLNYQTPQPSSAPRTAAAAAASSTSTPHRRHHRHESDCPKYSPITPITPQFGPEQTPPPTRSPSSAWRPGGYGSAYARPFQETQTYEPQPPPLRAQPSYRSYSPFMRSANTQPPPPSQSQSPTKPRPSSRPTSRPPSQPPSSQTHQRVSFAERTQTIPSAIRGPRPESGPGSGLGSSAGSPRKARRVTPSKKLFNKAVEELREKRMAEQRASQSQRKSGYRVDVPGAFNEW